MKVLTLAAAAMLLFGTASPSFAWVPGPSNFEETVFDNYPSAEKALDIEQPREPWNAESASDNAEYRKKVIQYVSKSKKFITAAENDKKRIDEQIDQSEENKDEVVRQYNWWRYKEHVKGEDLRVDEIE